MIRLEIKNEGAEDWRGCMVAIECDSFSSAATAKPKYEAAELTPKGGAVISAANAPELRAVGAVAAGTGAISPGLPAGTVAGDLLVMVAESGGATASAEANAALTATGWLEKDSQKQGNTRLTILYKIAAGGDATTTNDTGDHQLARIIGIKAGTFDPKAPFNVSAKGTQAATKAVSIPGLATTRDKCLIIACASGNLPDATGTSEFSAAANPVLTGVTERIDNTTAEGDGGALFAATGVLALAGPYSGYPTTATAVTEAERAVISLAVNPIGEAVKCPNLSFGWQTVLSSEIVGVGHMTHVDPRRLVFRLNDPSSVLEDVQWKAEWRQNGQAAWVQTVEASTPIVRSSPVLSAYQLLDMGEARPELPLAGSPRFEWRLQARSLSGSGKQPLIRDVYPMTTEQWQRVADTSDSAIDGEPVKTPGKVEDATGVGTVTWTNPEKAAVEGGGAAGIELAKGAVSHYLKALNLGLPIPPGATPRGVKIEAETGVSFGSSNPTEGIFDNQVRLIVGGVVKSAVDQARSDAWAGGRRSWGGSDDLWGLALTQADCIASNFGVAISVKFAAALETIASAAIDGMWITVAYSEGGNENRVCFATRSLQFSDVGPRRQHVTDEVWGELIPDGLDLQAPVPGQAAQPMRVMVVPSVGDFAARADSASTKLNAKLYYRPAYLSAREAV